MSISHEQILELLNAGIRCYQQGDLIRAEQIYRQVLAVQPRNADALHLLGLVVRDRGDAEGAIHLIRKAIKIVPTFYGARYNLADTYLGMDRLAEAIDGFQRVVKLKPDYADAFNGLGIALLRSNQLQAALDAFAKALAIKPDYVEAHTNSGAVLRTLGRLAESEACHRKALEMQPKFALALVNLANLYVDQGRLAEAKKLCAEAIALQPQNALAHRTLGNLFLAEGLVEEAISAFEKAVALNPRDLSLHSSLLFALNYSTAHSPSAIYTAHENWGRQLMQTVVPKAAPKNSCPDESKRLKLGYVSPDFRRHAVAYLIEPVLAAHNHDGFHVVCYANVAKEDEVTQRLRSMADEWRDIAGMNDAAVADMIRRDQIDILVDLAGHTAGSRLAVFAHKPAPVQVSWLGYYNTSGLPAIDYILSDPVSSPAQDAQLFVEELVRLPHTRFCYRPPEYAPEVAKVPSITAQQVTFGSFNKLVKINHDVVAAWSQILTRIPGSRLVLKAKQFAEPDERKHWESLFLKHGVTAERLNLRGYSPHAEMLGEYADIDIALDPFPFTGGITSFEALWMGVPVVTLSGETIVGRQTASMLAVMGHHELIAHSREQYVQLAVTLANNVMRLGELRQTLRADMAHSPLCDAAGFTCDLEEVYRNLWKRWCEHALVKSG